VTNSRTHRTQGKQRARERIGESLGRSVEKGRCTAAERDEALARLSVASDLDPAASRRWSPSS